MSGWVYWVALDEDFSVADSKRTHYTNWIVGITADAKKRAQTHELLMQLDEKVLVLPADAAGEDRGSEFGLHAVATDGGKGRHSGRMCRRGITMLMQQVCTGPRTIFRRCSRFYTNH